MRGRLSAVISDVRDMELLDGARVDCLSLRPLMARIARRPGRWRARMQGLGKRSEPADESWEQHLPEAA